MLQTWSGNSDMFILFLLAGRRLLTDTIHTSHRKCRVESESFSLTHRITLVLFCESDAGNSFFNLSETSAAGRQESADLCSRLSNHIQEFLFVFATDRIILLSERILTETDYMCHDKIPFVET